MKISYNWLKEYIDIDLSPEKAGEILTDTGLEVEGIDVYEPVKGGFAGLVVGKVLSCNKHPDADKLSVTMVDIGRDTPSPIVCGAPNVATGQTVIVATVGTTLYPTEGDAFKIKKAKIRGEVSEGMICAEDEIGLGFSHDGIIVLDNKYQAGMPAIECFDIKNDHVIEIGLTPNRADGTSHIGVARDLKAITGQEIKWPDVSAFAKDNSNLNIKVSVENSIACPRYSSVTLSGIKVSESPDWLKHRLRAIGLSPINNIVDITNYVLHETGQPLHAFDADQITGGEVNVKTLAKETVFTTLDGQERELNDTDLMICDQNKGMCIAGVFGGINSGVTQSTTNIFLESAYFSPDSVRKTSLAHQLKTDASFRFERGTDPLLTVYALKRAALLIKEIAGGTISSEITDIYPQEISAFHVNVSYKNITRLIGKDLGKDTVHKILTSLDINIENKSEEGFTAIVPPYRVDVQREADVIEEILRIYGFDNVELPEFVGSSYMADFPKHDSGKIQQDVSKLLAGNGYYEILTNSLTKPEYSETMNCIDENKNVVILNKLSEDLGVLRQSLLFNGLEVLTHNINRRQKNLRLFEFGKQYSKENEKYIEEQKLGLFITGKQNEENWIENSADITFHELKKIVLNILSKLGIGQPESISISNNDLFDFGLALSLNQKEIATIGKISSKAMKLTGLKQEVFYAELHWDLVLRKTINNIAMEQISKFPEVRRDLSIVIDKNVKFEEVKSVALKAERKILKQLDVFDVYQGNKIGQDQKAYAMKFILEDKTKTLTDKQIDKTMNRLIQVFEKEFGAIIRQ